MAEKELDPKTLEEKYKYQSDQDDAAIAKVENAIKARFGDGGASYKKGLEDSPVKQEEFDAKKKEYNDKIEQAKKDQPEDAKKEGAPPPLLSAPAAKPAVQKPNVPPSTESPKKQQAAGAAHEPHKAGPQKPAANGAPAPMPAPPTELVLQAAASGDGNLDKFLDDYPNKSPETTGQLSKIKQMGDVARGFDGQVEGYVSSGTSALEPVKGAAVNFLGKKEMSAIFSHNPYEKVEGGLGRIMRGLSTFQNVVSIVGNVTGKLGMILTVVGLLGMIFPPLGAAIEAIARVLNLIGLVCDGVGFALSMVLTSLNGVVLAQQIARGGSNEEKAASADMMVSEATAASGHVMNLALNYGPKFMKGFKGASKGVIGSLMKRFKSAVGKFATKALGPVQNWAKKAVYTMGFGLKEAGPPSAVMGFAKKAWNAPGALLEKARDSDFVKHINASSFSKKAENFAARLNSNSFLKDDLAEKAAQGIGNAGQTKFSGFSKRMRDAAESDEKAAAHMAAESAAQNAGNRERAKIEREITQKRDFGNREYEASTAGGQGVRDEAAAVRSREAYEQADKLEARESANVTKAEKEGRREKQKEQREAADEKRNEEYKERQEERNKEHFNEDPVAFRKETGQIEHRYNELRHKLKNPRLTDDVREKLERDAERMKKGLDQRKLIGYEASGGEPVENLLEAHHQLKEGWEHAHLKDQHAEWVEAGTKQVEKKTGHEDNEKFERHERQEKIEEFADEPAPHTADQVDAMLVGLDDEHDDSDAAAADDTDHSADDSAHDADVAPPTVAAAATSAPPVPDEGGPSVAPAIAAAPAAAEPPAPKKEEAPETPELAYWPKLVGNEGEFKKAASELHRMKMVAYAFRKAQLDARKQAIDVAANFGKYAEVTARYQQNATTQGGSLQKTIHEATQAGGAADQGSAHASAGAKKQQDGEAHGSGKEEQVPDVGEKPSRWHPFKRVLWYMKKWAADKAAHVFGWIQGKITNIILKAVCGVSMDDMRAYTTALHHRMEFSKVAGTQGTEAAKRAVVGAGEAKANSNDYGAQALADAKECDQNINDADAFVKDVEGTEQNLAAEQARAALFLSGLAAAVAAEKQRRQEEEQKKAADAAKTQQTNAGAPAPGASSASSAPPGTLAAAIVAPKKKQKPALSAAAATKVKAAAGYVLSQADVLTSQLASTRDQRADRLKSRVDAMPLLQKLSFAKLDGTGNGTIEAFRLHVGEIVIAMHNVQNRNPADRQGLKGLAAEVRQHARALDDASSTAHQSLNFAFKSAYEKVSNVA